MVKSLEDYLIEVPGNKENLSSLVDLLKKNRDKCACFLGAGLPSQFKGVPDAKELVERLKKTYKKKIQFNGDLPDFCSKLYKSLQEEQRENFYLTVFEEIVPSDFSGTQTNLCKIFTSFVTLNFKDSIELAFEDKHGQSLNVFYFRYPKDYPNYNLTYMHGNEELGTAVLRKEDYKYYYSFLDKPGQNLVLFNSYKHLLEKRNVIFCAISMESVLAKTLEKIKSESKSEEFGNHFWVVDEETWNAFVNRHFSQENKKKEDARQKEEMKNQVISICQNRFGLKPVIYKDEKHRFLASLCAEVGSPTSNAIVEPTEQSMGEIK